MTADTRTAARPDPPARTPLPDAVKWPDMITVDGIEKAFQARWDAEGVQKTFRLPADFLSRDADDQVFLLVGLEREAAGVPPYQRIGGALLKVTRKLADEGRVSHGTMDQRIAAAGLPPGNIGEAVASNATPAGAVFGWMYHDSDPAWGHRRGIISPDFTYVSVAHGDGAPQWTGREMMPIQIYGLNYGLSSYREPSSGDDSPTPISSPAGSSSGTTSSTREKSVPDRPASGGGNVPGAPGTGGGVPGGVPGGGAGVGTAADVGAGGGPGTGVKDPIRGSGSGPAAPSGGGQRVGRPGSGSGRGASTTIAGGGTASHEGAIRTGPQDTSSSTGRTIEQTDKPAPTRLVTPEQSTPQRVPPAEERHDPAPSPAAGYRVPPVEQPKPQRIAPAEEHHDAVRSVGYRVPPAEQPKPQRILPAEEHRDPTSSTGYRILPVEQAKPERILPVEQAKPQRILPPEQAKPQRVLPAEEHRDPAPSPAAGYRIPPVEQTKPERILPVEQAKPERILPVEQTKPERVLPAEEHRDPTSSTGYRVPPVEQPEPQRILPPEQAKPQRVLPAEERHDPAPSPAAGYRIPPVEQTKPERILPAEEHRDAGRSTGTRTAQPGAHPSSGTGVRAGTAGKSGGRVESVDAPLRDLGATPTSAEITRAFQAQWDTRYPGRRFELPTDFAQRSPQEQTVVLVNLERGAAGLEPMRLGSGALAHAAQDRATRGVPTLGRPYLDGLAGHYRQSIGIATASPAVAIYRWMYLSPHDVRPGHSLMDKELTWAGIGLGRTQGGQPVITVDLARATYDDTRTMTAPATVAYRQPGTAPHPVPPTQQYVQQYPQRLPLPDPTTAGYGRPPRRGMRPVVKGGIAAAVVGAAIVGAVALATQTSVLGGTSTSTVPSSVSNAVSPGGSPTVPNGKQLPGAVRPGVGSNQARPPSSGGTAPGASGGGATGAGTSGNGTSGTGAAGGGAAGGGTAVSPGAGGEAGPPPRDGESPGSGSGSSSGGGSGTAPAAVDPDFSGNGG